MFVHSESFVFVVKAKLTQNDEEVKKSNQSITLYAYIHNKRNANRKEAQKKLFCFSDVYLSCWFAYMYENEWKMIQQ